MKRQITIIDCLESSVILNTKKLKIKENMYNGYIFADVLFLYLNQ